MYYKNYIKIIFKENLNINKNEEINFYNKMKQVIPFYKSNFLYDLI